MGPNSGGPRKGGNNEYEQTKKPTLAVGHGRLYRARYNGNRAARLRWRVHHRVVVMIIVTLARAVASWLIKRGVRQALLLLSSIPLGGCAITRIEIPHSFIEPPRLELLIAVRNIVHDQNATEK